MAWVAVEQNGVEVIFGEKPERDEKDLCWRYLVEVSVFYDDPEQDYYEYGIMIPKGSIKKLIGRELAWEDNPVELKEE